MKAFYKTGQSQPTIIYPTGTMVERPDDDGFIESDAIKEPYVQAYDMDFSAYPPTVTRKPNADQIIADLLAPKPEELQAEAEAVVMQHMVKEKVAELTWKDDTQYHVGDVVYHKGKMWTSTSNNMNNEPDDVPGDWTETD